MNTLTTKLTDDELIRVSRAMERAGFSSVEEYFHWAVTKQTEAALAEKAANKED